MEFDGFVYIWRDNEKNMYYIGSHYGRVDDSYICSSIWMKRAYKRRPNTFTRKILKRIRGSKIDILREEQKWLDLIKDHEIGKRYYNLKKIAAGGNGYANRGVPKRLPVWNVGKKTGPRSEETKRKISESRMQRFKTKSKPLNSCIWCSYFPVKNKFCSSRCVAKHRAQSGEFGFQRSCNQDAAQGKRRLNSVARSQPSKTPTPLVKKPN